MAIDIHCSCGTVWRIEGDAARARPVCADCGRTLDCATAAVPTVKLAPLPARPEIETVAVVPFYQPDPPAKAPAIGDDVVATARIDPDPPPRPLRSHVGARRPEDNDDHRPYYMQSEFEEQELRRLVAHTRREMWRYGLPRTRPLDRNVWDCFLFAGRAWWVILILAFGWLILTPTIMLALPTPQSWGPEIWAPRIFACAVLLVCLAATWTLLRDMHGMGAEGKRELQFRMLFDWRSLTQSALMVIVALLAGPMVLVAAAVWYWVGAGELDWLDTLILTELSLAAGIAWVYSLAACNRQARWRDVHLPAIVELVRNQGWPGWVFPLVGGVSVTVFAFTQVQLLAVMMEHPFPAVVLQFMLWLGALYFWTGLMRWYGIKRYQRGQAQPATA